MLYSDIGTCGHVSMSKNKRKIGKEKDRKERERERVRAEVSDALSARHAG